MCFGISFGIIWGNMSPQARETNKQNKTKKTRVTISKLKALHTKETINKTNRPLTEREDI